MNNIAKMIIEKSVFVRLEFSKLGNSKKGDTSKIETDADKKRLRLSKVLFDCPEYNAIKTFDNALRGWICDRAISVDVGFQGVYILPLEILPAVEESLKESKENRAELVAAFLNVYDGQREEARERLNGQFKDSDFPPRAVAAESFGLKWRYVTFDVPSNLPPEIAEQERADREEQFRSMAEDVRLALRESLGDLVGHLADKLSPGEEGQKKIFRDTTVTNLEQFLQLFSARNITDDVELAKLVGRAQTIIKDASPEALRMDGTIRERVREGMAEVKAAVSELITTQARRKFNFED